jgi:hypothetical protein
LAESDPQDDVEVDSLAEEDEKWTAWRKP